MNFLLIQKYQISFGKSGGLFYQPSHTVTPLIHYGLVLKHVPSIPSVAAIAASLLPDALATIG